MSGSTHFCQIDIDLRSGSVNCELDTQIVTNRLVQITGNGEDKDYNLSLNQFKPS